MKQRRRILAMLVALATLTTLAPAVTASSPPPGLKIEAGAGFDGYFKYGEWLPVWVHLENTGPDRQAEIRVRLVDILGTKTFAVPVALPTGSRKRIPVYVLPNNYSHELEVQLVDGHDLLLSQKIPVKPQPNINYLVALISPERGAVSLLLGAAPPGKERPKELVDLPLAELPERPEGLRSFDCLILNDVDTSPLTPGQQAALEAWVHQGGHLVIGGGAGARRTVAGLPDSLLPLDPRSELELNALSGLADFARAETVRVPGPFLVATGEPGAGRTLAAQDGLPLVRERTVGGGRVDFVALDLAASPFDAWAGTTAFWERLVLADALYPQGIPPDTSVRQLRSGQMTYALSNLPALDLPSVQGLALLLVLYVTLVGPVNYVLLRWRKRLHWAWITIPAITVAFSGAAFGLGYALRGTDLILNKIAIAGLQPDGSASVSTYMGLFSPSRQSYEIEVTGNGLLSPLTPDGNPFDPGDAGSPGEVVFVQDDPGRVRGLAVNQWSMQSFMTEGTWADLGHIVGDLRIEGGALVGTIRNETRLALTDVVLIQGNHFVRLGDLEPGTEVAANIELSDLVNEAFGPPLSYLLFQDQFNQPLPGGPPREAQLKQNVVDSLFLSGGRFALGPVPDLDFPTVSSGNSPSGPLLLGWFDEAPPEVRVAGREIAQQTTALLYAPLTYRLADTGHISLPPGLIPGHLIELPLEGGTCGPPGTSAVYLGRGQALFEFLLPENILDSQLDKLVLYIGTEGGWNQNPDAAIYNWTTGAWAEVKDPAPGRNVISGTQGLVSEDGLVQVRISSDGNQGGCYFLELGFEGTR